jgi:hypothetical protein
VRPQPGVTWASSGQPERQPHEYPRLGATKLLTLLRPATGQVRAEPSVQTRNTELHPWLKKELTAVLADLAEAPTPRTTWADWLPRVPTALPGDPRQWAPLRVLLIWDNLRGHKTPALVQWLLEHGILPLYTPIAGSWLNLAESVQRILGQRALGGQVPTSVAQLQTWLRATVIGWNAAPTPFHWGGKRAARRQRARERRHTLGGSGGYTRQAVHRVRRRPANPARSGK